jgi:penicillin-binding protein 1A
VAELAREKAIRTFGLEAYTEGYQVYTTVDSTLQNAAQKAIINGLDAYTKRHGYRGPETPYELPELIDEASKSSLISKLADIPTIGYALPALVLSITDTNANVVLSDGATVELSWENGLSDARKYLTENTRGPRPTLVSDVVSPGDVIRVKRSGENDWMLTQIPAAQSALASVDPDNGAILALAGGYDFYASHFNRATQAYRQAGSSLKPFIYATGLENGMTAASLINDSPIVVTDSDYEGTWRPKNDGGKFYGPMRLRKALYLSRNLVSIRILQQLGIRTATDALVRFGFSKSALPRDLSLALGNSSVTPLEMATAWAIFANGGYKVGAHLIQRVTDLDGHIVYEAFPKTVCTLCDTSNKAQEPSSPPWMNAASIANNIDFDPEIFELPLELKKMFGLLEQDDYPQASKVLDDQVAFLMDSILKDVIRRGTGTKARSLGRSDIAGKTGTTNGPNDAWFSGYSRDIVTTTWVGFDQNTPLGNSEYGGSAALPIWIEFMQVALKDRPTKVRPQPPGIVTVKIDADTGERARIDDPDGIFEYFRTENVPPLKADQENGKSEIFDNYYSEDIF